MNKEYTYFVSWICGTSYGNGVFSQHTPILNPNDIQTLERLLADEYKLEYESLTIMSITNLGVA